MDASSSINRCSICLEEMSQQCDRTVIKLQCSHMFHMDCIGSAFNMKGFMECPNCRQIENGVWRLFGANRPGEDMDQELVFQNDQAFIETDVQEPGVQAHPLQQLRLGIQSQGYADHIVINPSVTIFGGPWYHGVINPSVTLFGGPLFYHQLLSPVYADQSVVHPSVNIVGTPYFNHQWSDPCVPNGIFGANVLELEAIAQYYHILNLFTSISLHDHLIGAPQFLVPPATLSSASANFAELYGHRDHGAALFGQSLHNVPSPMVEANNAYHISSVDQNRSWRERSSQHPPERYQGRYAEMFPESHNEDEYPYTRG
ncbi:RING finger family protein [Quillaja saponaria]|uniref:RING finger family protein n=1 Tax=Quillaja saponaria TaxID=32244 RepID=A0AAD7QEZ1_QUISA|nr:RING finger family protein [Quillaja saponaria]